MSGSHGVPLSEAIELAAVRDLFRAVPAELAARHGIEVAEVGGVTVTALRDVPSNSMFDRALGLGLERSVGEAAVDEVARGSMTAASISSFPSRPRPARPSFPSGWHDAGSSRRGRG